MTEEERAALKRFLEETPTRPMNGRARVMAWAALKFAATLLVVAGVGIAVGDGNEFDGVDCGVAAKPPGYTKSPESAKARGADCDKPKGSGDGAASGPGTSPSAFGLGAVLAELPSQCFGAASAVVKTVEAAMHRFEGKLDAIASGNLEVLKENGELRALHRDGFFKFALRVEAEDFRAFAAIMALGNRKAAARVLEVPARTFYDRVRKWNKRGMEYQRMAELVGWRKRTGRRIKLRLEDSVQSGEPNDEAENPVTVGAVLESITSAGAQDYPAILRQVMETLEAQNPGNWAKVREELVEMIKEEMG